VKEETVQLMVDKRQEREILHRLIFSFSSFIPSNLSAYETVTATFRADLPCLVNPLGTTVTDIPSGVLF
jgi:hypothetical protein